MTKPVIGFDFGNYNSFTCFISDFDEGTRMGGIIHDLLPQGLNDGIPSMFFYSDKLGILCGEDAIRNRAKPVQNRTRNLKRHLGQTIHFEKESRNISYDEAITAVIQHCVRQANVQLLAGYQVTTNLISLSYPATYTFAQRQRLIELAEKATLEDGTKVKVFGTIAEPAAAALDYLAEFAKTKNETTVLVYDLGGGTFDLALVAAYPAGRKNSAGLPYFYDIINTRGLAKVGGSDFDEIMYNLLVKKFSVPLKPTHQLTLHTMAEGTKIALSDDEYADEELMYGDDYIEARITRNEFERESRSLLQQTIDATKKILADHPGQKPEFILLTGGASQMPMVRRELEAQLPEYRGKIKFYRPSRAIAYGAARYGTSEANTDPLRAGSIVQQRTMFDLGVRFYRSQNDKVGYISTYIKAGTPIPYQTSYWTSQTIIESGQQYSEFAVCEAKHENPDRNKPTEDYNEIMSITLDRGRKVPKGTESETRLVVDKLGVLTIEAREKNEPGKPVISNTIKLKNLS